MAKRLAVCWEPPAGVLEEEMLLSFLLPSAEADFRSQALLISGRDASRAVRGQARALYIELVAQIGAATDNAGRSFRGLLADGSKASRWWYHPVAFKDCEQDPTFKWMIAILTVCEVAEKYGIRELTLYGAPRAVAAVLRSLYAVEERQKPLVIPVWIEVLRWLASRVSYAIKLLFRLRRLSSVCRSRDRSFDVVFSGFWDWSVYWDYEAQRLSDRYFKDLPAELKRQGVSSMGWFAWLDPHFQSAMAGRNVKEVLNSIRDQEEVVILQGFLGLRESVRIIADFSALRTFLGIRKARWFRNAFRACGIDFYPLFSAQLLQGFVNASLPHCELVALATSRACQQYRPRLTFSFLEHFPYSRAHYEGVRRASLDTVCFAVQHASYSREKTFLFFHPTIEFLGKPDGHAPPQPHYACAMGKLGYELFLDCGYPSERVLLTGSSRYDYVRPMACALEKTDDNRRKRRGISLLIVPSLDLDAELDMVDAVCAAAAGLPGVQLYLRNHPFSPMDQHPGFRPYRKFMQVTQAPLYEDLARADLILYTYSTVAEEAVLIGKAVWQWLPLGSNASALAEVGAVLAFSSVDRLREAIQDFVCQPKQFLPGVQTRQLVLDRLFYPGDGRAAQRIAAAAARKLVMTVRQTIPA